MKAELSDCDSMNVDAFEDLSPRTYRVGGEAYGSWISELKYHPPQGEGDKHFIDLHLANGRVVRCFEINVIWFN